MASSAGGNRNSNGSSQESYCMVSFTDITPKTDHTDLLQAQAEEELIKCGENQEEDEDLIRRLELLKSPSDDLDDIIIDDTDDECPTYDRDLLPQALPRRRETQWEGSRERPSSGEQRFYTEQSSSGSQDGRDFRRCVSANNSPDIRLQKPGVDTGVNPLVRDTASLNLLGKNASSETNDKGSDRRSPNPGPKPQRPNVPPRASKPSRRGRPIIRTINSDSSSDDELIATRTPLYSMPMASSEEDEITLTESDEDAYEFLHNVGYPYPAVPVPLKIIKRASQMHKVEYIMNTYFLLGFEDGHCGKSLEEIAGPASAEEFRKKLDLLMSAGLKSDVDEPLVYRQRGTGSNTPEECSDKKRGPCDQRRPVSTCTSTSTDEGAEVFYDASPDRPGSTGGVVSEPEVNEGEAEETSPKHDLWGSTGFEAGQVGLDEVEMEGANDWKEMLKQKPEEISRHTSDASTSGRTGHGNDADDDDTLTDNSGGKDSKTSDLDVQGRQDKGSGKGPTTEKSIQTTCPEQHRVKGHSDVTSRHSSTRVEQAVQTAPCSFYSTEVIETIEKSSQTTTLSGRSSESDVKEDGDPRTRRCLEILVQEQLKVLKKVAEERNDLLDYLETKEQTWNKKAQRYQKEITSLRAFASQVLSDKLASGRSLNRSAHSALLRAVEDQDKKMAMCFQLRNKISELQMQVSSQMKLICELVEEMDAARTALEIHEEKITIRKVPELQTSHENRSSLYKMLHCDRAAYTPSTTDDPELALLDTFKLGGSRVLPLNAEGDEDYLSVFDCLAVPIMKDYIMNGENKQEHLKDVAKSVEEMARERDSEYGAL